MGRISTASSAPSYARLSRKAPQLQSTAPAWIIQFHGERNSLKSAESWIDPTCVFVDGDAVTYSTGPVRDMKTGLFIRGYWSEDAPATWSLPPLAP
jgi:hypothetical protein